MPPKIEASLVPASLFSIPTPLSEKSDTRYALGQVVRDLRKEKGMSQEELAKRSGVDRSTIGRVECGIFKTLSVEKLEVIAQAVGTDLKTLLLKSDSNPESVCVRSHMSRVEFALDYPADGFKIISHVPKRKEFFFGKIEINPQKTIPSSKLPHPEQIYLHALEGKLLLNQDRKEMVLKPGDCFTFNGFSEYEFYNPDPLKLVSALFITYPSFSLI